MSEPDRPPRLEVRRLGKTYPGTVALHDFDITIRAGEVHSLVGTNGSGKSTFIKILAGVVRADADGEVVLDGEAFDAAALNPAWAARHRLRFVHQQLTVFDDLSVAENLAYGPGFARSRVRAISWRRTHERATETLARFQLEIDPSRTVGSLRPAQRVMIAIARALQGDEHEGGGLLVLDEPTAALPKSEVSHLLETVRQVAAAGRSVLYVSHRLDEVLEVSDQVTVIRDGRRRTTEPAASMSHDALVERMLGAAIVVDHRPIRDGAGDRLLTIDRLSSGPLRDVSLVLHRGEVLGIAGLLGSGRSHLLRALFGCERPDAEAVTLEGAPYRPLSPRDAMDRKVAFVPEDRGSDAAFLDHSVADNLTIADLRRNFRRVFLDPRREQATATELVARFGVRTASPATHIGALSGGNQQKVVMARWLALEPTLLLLDEPSQGVDAGARVDIHALVRRATDAGAGALVVSSDSEELAQHCDRVLVLARGRIAAEITGESLTAHSIDQLVFRSQMEELPA
jgi:ribose transport system ATP-binding protein